MSVTVNKSQSSAWRKSKRVLRLSVGPGLSRMAGTRTAIERLLCGSQVRVRPEREFLRRSVSKVLARRTIRRESCAEERRQKSGGPEQRNASCDGASAKTNCDVREMKISRVIQMACKTGSPPVAKVAGQTSRPRDRRNTENASFSDCLRSYSKPERERNKQRAALDGRPVEFRQQASALGHSPERIARCGSA